MIYEIGDTTLGSRHTAIKMWEVFVESGKRPMREHRHIYFEISLVLDGQGIYRTWQGDKPIAKDSVFVYASNEPHCITEVGSAGLHMLNLQFSSKVTENMPLLEEQYPLVFYSHAREFNCRIENDPVLSGLLLQIREEFSQKQEGFSCAVTGLIGQLLLRLIRCHGFCQEDTPSSGVIQKLQNGISYINGHYCEDLTLEEIAGQSSITPNYFSALFRECLNMKLWDYITAKRIERAKRLLHKQDCDLSVLEIAAQCGFNNTANFNRAFRQHTGITPSQYRASSYSDFA